MSGFPKASGDATKFRGKTLKLGAPADGNIWVYVAANDDYELQAQAGAGGGANVNDPFVVNGTAADLPNAQQLSGVLGRGTLASRPAAAAGNHYWYYFASDTAQWYQSNGATWDSLTPLGSDPSRLAIAQNLADLANAATARTNLGLGAAALLADPITIGHGGTGQTTQQAAIDALTGTQVAGTALRSDGTHATLGQRSRALFVAATQSAIASITTSATLFSLTPPASNLVAANTLQVGDILRLYASGTLTNSSGGAATMGVTVKFGTASIAASPNVSVASAAGNRQWFAEITIAITSLGAGASGTAYGISVMNTSGNGNQQVVLANSELASVAWVGDTTVDNTFDVLLTSSVNNANTGGTLQACHVEKMTV